MATAALAIVFWLGRRQAPNLLLVTIDTLRADHVGAYGYPQGTTPVLDALARRGVRFDQVQSSAPLTGPAHATIFTGLAPPAHGLRDNELVSLDPRHPLLASALQGRGYNTAAFVGGYPVTSPFGFARGFATFDEAFRRSGTERPADQVANAALMWLTATREPFFAWLHFFDPHAPYDPPSPFRERSSPYDGEVAFADAQLGRVLQALEDGKRLGRTLVVVLSDHGEGLGDHGEATHGILVYESTLRVPWIMAGPRVPQGGVLTDRVGTVDVLPTVLSILGVEPPQGLPGRKLLAALPGRTRAPAAGLYGESLLGLLACRWSALRTWTEADWKLILGAEPELYDVAQDPGETRNLAADQPERVARMRGELEATMRRMAPAGDAPGPTAVSPEHEERLRSLGYLGGTAPSELALDAPGRPDPRAHVGDYERLQALVARPEDPGVVAEARALAERQPGSPAAHYTLALLAQRHGDQPLAARAFARTLELDPRPNVRDAYGRLLREMGRLEESERELRQALAAGGPYAGRITVNLAETLAARGEEAAARKLLGELLRKEPANAQAQELVGRLILRRFQP